MFSFTLSLLWLNVYNLPVYILAGVCHHPFFVMAWNIKKPCHCPQLSEPCLCIGGYHYPVFAGYLHPVFPGLVFIITLSLPLDWGLLLSCLCPCMVFIISLSFYWLGVYHYGVFGIVCVYYYPGFVLPVSILSVQESRQGKNLALCPPFLDSVVTSLEYIFSSLFLSFILIE